MLKMLSLFIKYLLLYIIKQVILAIPIVIQIKIIILSEIDSALRLILLALHRTIIDTLVNESYNIKPFNTDYTHL